MTSGKSGHPSPGAPATGALRTVSLGDVRLFAQTYGALIALFLLVGYNVFFNAGAFLSRSGMNANLTQVAPIVIVAIGMTFVIATGGIDLSVGALMAISGVMAPIIFLSDVWPLNVPYLGGALAYVIPIVIAGAFGGFNAFLITQFGIQPIIATLILFISGRGVAQMITSGRIQTFREPDWQYVGLGRPLGIPFQAIIMLLVVLGAWWLMRSTAFGRYVLAVGGNESAARLAGVPVRRVKYSVYILSGLLSGLAGLIGIALLSAADPARIGLNMELNAIAAAAVGGTSLMGGRATIIGTLIGAFIIQLTRFTLLTEGLPDASVRIVTAGAILVAVLFQRRSR